MKIPFKFLIFLILHKSVGDTHILQGLNACPSDSQKVIINYQQGFNIETLQQVTCQGYAGSITIIAENSTISPIVYSIDGGTFVSYYSFQNLEWGL